MANEIILYKCNKCAAPVYQDQIDRGDSCRKCGSRHVTYAPPTMRYVIGYLIHTKSMLQYVKENILGWV